MDNSGGGRVTEPTIRVQSCGAGVQSTALALLMRDGRLPTVDHAIFADTGWEPVNVYRQVDRLAELFAEIGVTFHHVSQGNLREDSINPGHRFASIPYHVRNPDGSRGIGRRQCTSEYKLAPINRKVRELLGAKAPAFRSVPRGRVAEQWIGFSTDEIGRVGPKGHGVLYQRPRYPLLELGMSRRDCVRYLERSGWGDTPKSACIGCPYHGHRQWRALRDTCECGHHRDEHPREGCSGFHAPEWDDAVEFDRAIRKGGARGLPLNGEAFLSRTLHPLDVAPIDHWTRGDIAAATAEAQGDLFDLVEDGDADGCSPYGCRSGTSTDEVAT